MSPRSSPNQHDHLCLCGFNLQTTLLLGALVAPISLFGCAKEKSGCPDIPAPQEVVNRSLNDALQKDDLSPEALLAVLGASDFVVLQFEAGLLVPVFRNGLSRLPPDFSGSGSFSDLIKRQELPGNLVNQSDNSWANPENVETYNCHAFTLGECFGLGPNDRVEGGAAMWLVLGYNPIQALLAKYADKLTVLDASPAAAVSIEIGGEFRSGDLVFFVRELDGMAIYEHSGKLIDHAGSNWMIHRPGVDPLMVTPISVALGVYGDVTSRIEVWRLRE